MLNATNKNRNPQSTATSSEGGHRGGPSVISPDALRAGHGATVDNPVHRTQAVLEDTFKKRHHDQIDETQPAGACLRPLLDALQWSGRARHLAEALPHFDAVRDINGLRTFLANINFTGAPRRVALADLHPEMLPCLFESDEHSLVVVLSIESDRSLRIFDGASGSDARIEPSNLIGTAYPITRGRADRELTGSGGKQWMYELLSRFRQTFAFLCSLSLAINLLTLAIPLYIMAVYEQAIGARSFVTLATLFAGISLIVLAELSLRRIRARALTYLGTRIENIVVVQVFQKLMHLPVAMTETASISSQLNKFRQFEGLREIFAGSLANAILDLPFLVIFMVAVFVIGGPMGFIPLALFLAYVTMAAISIPISRSMHIESGIVRNQRRDILREITAKHNAIRDHQAGWIWHGRFAEANCNYLLDRFRGQQFNLLIQTLSQSLAGIAGAATVGIGTLFALEGQLSIGALIATTALVWRGLSPLQSAFLGLKQIGQAIESFRQINQLMRLTQERNPGSLSTYTRNFAGKITVHDTSFRYGARTEPALRGISIRSEPGELIAITGPSAAGKSTLLKIIAGLYVPQAGTVYIDDLDIRQFDVADIRQSIGYVPQKCQLFYGTIGQNLKLAHPTASIEEIEFALDRVGALDEVRQLPEGIHTRLSGLSERRLSSGLLKQISLARAFIKDAPIYLLDEPGSDLDYRSDEHLIELLKSLKGRASVYLISHRPSHLRLADRVFYLNAGRVVADGSPDAILKRLLGSKAPDTRPATRSSSPNQAGGNPETPATAKPTNGRQGQC